MNVSIAGMYRPGNTTTTALHKKASFGPWQEPTDAQAPYGKDYHWRVGTWDYAEATIEFVELQNMVDGSVVLRTASMVDIHHGRVALDALIPTGILSTFLLLSIYAISQAMSWLRARQGPQGFDVLPLNSPSQGDRHD